MRPWSDPRIISKTPLATIVLLEHANIQQLIRMWSEGTAEGQSLWGWISVGFALALFINFYRVCCPKEKFAFWATVLGLGMNLLVILTVVWFRYLV